MPGGRHILMVAAVYPPVDGPSGAAGVRARALARGLRARGHRVTVVCARTAGNPARDDEGVRVVPAAWLDVEARARDIGIDMRDVPRPVGGGRSRTTIVRELAARLTVPDRYVIWVPPAAAAARRAGRGADVVMSTGPVSAHLVARSTRGARPWIADLNDLWALNPHRTNGRLRDWVDVALERATLRAAAHLTTVNEPLCDEWRRRTGRPVTSLRSGFDPGDFPQRRPPGGDPVRLLYSGTLYPSQDLTPLFEAIDTGRREGWLTPRRLRVSFVGRVSDRALEAAREHAVAEFVEASEPVPRPALVERLAAAHALLLPLYGADSIALPMKLFEYVGAGRPVLAFGRPEDLTARVIAEHRLGVVAQGSPELARVLRDLVEGRPPPPPDEETRRRFTWDATVDRLAAIVESA